MDDSNRLADAYRDAFIAAKGYAPTIEPLPSGRFRIATATGSHDRYTARDVANLTRGLLVMANGKGGEA